MHSRQETSLVHSNWFKYRFLTRRSQYLLSRELIARSINHLLERERRRLDKQNTIIDRCLKDADRQIDKLKSKVHSLDDLHSLMHLPVQDYFEQRMARLRDSAEQHIAAVEQEIYEEMEHWQNIHAVLSRPWLEPGLLRSCHGGLPRPVQQSPSSDIETIAEENESIKSTKKSTRSLALINAFSILSNGMNERHSASDRLNKTFVKYRSTRNSSSMLDENSIEAFEADRKFSDSSRRSTDETIILID